MNELDGMSLARAIVEGVRGCVKDCPLDWYQQTDECECQAIVEHIQDALTEKTLIEKKWEMRPPETEPAARILWDLWMTVKRLDWLRYDGNGWTCQHSTGSLSFYDPEDGAFYGNSGVMSGAHYDVLKPVLPNEPVCLD